MLRWREMSAVRKVLFAAGWICSAAWVVLAILDETGALETTAICDALLAVWYLGIGCRVKIRWMRIVCYIFAGLEFLFCFRSMF